LALVAERDLPETSVVKIAVAWYCIVIGALLAVWWANDLRQGAWNWGDRTHGELGLHLAAEFVTAGLLIASGAACLVAGHAAPSASSKPSATPHPHPGSLTRTTHVQT
jgi:hypothetical protein